MVHKAVVLLSGGLDSATSLAIARDRGFECHALSFDYDQRHAIELDAARRVAQSQGVDDHIILNIALSRFGGSALTDPSLDVPTGKSSGIPVTYVPARNTIFLAYALAFAETLGSNDIFIGVNAVDYPGYPDCRPEYIRSFTETANLATRAGVEGNRLTIHTPLIDLTKKEIILTGSRLGVDYALTLSCYQPEEDGLACGECDSCHFRREGFRQAGLADPTRYRQPL